MSSQHVSRLEQLQCHFTWDLESRKSRLWQLLYKLEDIGTEVATCWRGCIYNLQGWVHFQLGQTEAAQLYFSRAAKALSLTPDSDEGLCLLVNYGNMAWLHHHLGHPAKSTFYLSKVDALLGRHPPSSQDELHPQVYTEKAWTLMNFGKDEKLLAVELFQRVLDLQPGRADLLSVQVLAMLSAHKHDKLPLDEQMFEKLRDAAQQQPENLSVSVWYLQLRERRGEEVFKELRHLTRRVLHSPVSSYSGLKLLLRLHQNLWGAGRAVGLAEEALTRHPEERYLKRCAALCYNWKIVAEEGPQLPWVVDRAIHLHLEVFRLYPGATLVKRLNLANIHAKIGDLDQAERIYQQHLVEDLEPAEKQVVYNFYANFLYFNQYNQDESRRFHMLAAEIPVPSFYRNSSIRVLRQILARGQRLMCNIQDLLARVDPLPVPLQS